LEKAISWLILCVAVKAVRTKPFKDSRTILRLQSIGLAETKTQIITENILIHKILSKFFNSQQKN
jgi:hypothetical protein